MTVTFSRVIPTLRMFDTAKAREFYLGYLGFAGRFRAPLRAGPRRYSSASREADSII
jgi:ribosomal-protein-alanine N-acetyltransferase